MAAEIGSQRRLGRSAVLALRSMVSDLSNLLLSSVIVHSIRPLPRGRHHFSRWRSRSQPVHMSRHRRGQASSFP
jgi:hypothetical protein